MLSKCMFPCIKRAVQLNTAAAISKSGIFSISRNFKMTRRFQSNGQKTFKEIADAESAIRGRSIAYYSISAVVMTVGLTYAAVPLYRMFCQVCELCIQLLPFRMGFYTISFHFIVNRIWRHFRHYTG